MADEAYWTEHGKIIKSPVKTKNEDGSTNISLGFPVCDVSEFVDAEELVEFLNRAEVCVAACAGIPSKQLEAGCVAELIKHCSELVGAQDVIESPDYDTPGGGKIAQWVWANARAAVAPFQKESD